MGTISRVLFLWTILHTACMHGQAQLECPADDVSAEGADASASPVRASGWSLMQQNTKDGYHADAKLERLHKAEQPATAMRHISFQVPGPEPGWQGQLHSQVGQDWLVASILGCKSGGFFLDLAANDASQLSNTLMLERDFGWKGICAEANLDYFYTLAQRRCSLFWGAVGAANKTVPFHMNGVLGGIVGQEFDNTQASVQGAGASKVVQLRTVPLATVLDSMGAPSTIDYFSLDVEGAESLVMQDFPWQRYTFLVLTVERPKPDLQERLSKAGYVYLRKNSPFNDVTYVHRSLPGLDAIMLTWRNHPGGVVPTSCMTTKNYRTPHGLLP